MIRSRLHRAATAASGHRFKHHRHYTRSLAAASSTTLQKTKPSFFDQVDEQMKQDYPEQYERYAESKRAYKLRKQNDDVVSPVATESKLFHERTGNDDVVEKMSSRSSYQREQNEVPWYKKIEQLQEPTSQSQAHIKETTTQIAETPKIEESNISLDVANTIKNTEKKSSIFSSISKSVSFQDGDKSTTIPLSELFPTLYAKESSDSTTSSSSSSNADTTDTNNNPNMMYDAKHFDAYREAMTAVMSHDKMQRTLSKFEKKDEANVQLVQKLKEWILSDHRIIDKEVVGDRWNNLEKHWREGWMVGGASSLMEDSNGDNNNGPVSNVMKSELKAQNELFQSTLLHADDENGDDHEGKKDPQTFNQMAQLLFTALGRYCAERARSVPMEVAWYKVKESGLVLPKDTISTYLYVVGTMGMGDSFRMTTAGDEEKKDGSESSISEEVVTYHDLAMKPTESSISLRVKAFASKGDAKTAQELLEAFKKTIGDDANNKEAIRLRTYLPILKQYCESKDVGAAVAVFKQMQSISTVILEPENYVLLLASIAENGYFCRNSPSIEGISHLGLGNESGPELFDELVSEMADDVLEISSASASRLHNALAIGFKDRPENKLKEMHPLASMPISRQPAESNEVVACRISLDRSSGICPVTEAQQRLLVLEPSQRRQLHDDLLSLSRDQFSKFAGKRDDETPERAAEELQKFSDWLNDRDGEPFTAILDGANIGYFMQSFDKGRFNYHQIKFMVDTLEERGENVLVVIPHKYGYNSFYTSKVQHQQLDAAERTIMNDLLRKKKLYKVPPRCLDDFYWMLASVSDQVTARKGVDLSVPNDDPSGRWPGVRPVLISNDQMRDHKWELLDEPRLFRRWYGCHIVNYNFTAFVGGECVDGNEIFFSQADFFSREIQGNPSGSGKAWHFPVSDWDLEERFAVRL